MHTVSGSFFIPAPVPDTYREWKSYIGFPDAERPGRRNLTVLEDRADEEVKWRSRWGLIEVLGQTDFIPAQGGCILHLKYAGIGLLPRLLFVKHRPTELLMRGLPVDATQVVKGPRRLIATRTVTKPFDALR
jgi:hypothetical protein